MDKNYFLEMIKSLREKEEVVLYERILKTSKEDNIEVITYLKNTYHSESLNYPYSAPEFNQEAALWAAKTVYIAAQLILYRQNANEELEALFPADNIESNPESILSVDLCIRFMPSLIYQLKLIDSEDYLLGILESKLAKWHYSGINYHNIPGNSDYSIVCSNKCLEQLYINRIIKYKNIKLAKNPIFNNKIRANMGIYSEIYWKGFNLINIDE